LTSFDFARKAVDAALSEFGQSLAVVTSFQREGIVIVDLVLSVAPQIPVVTIDTGRMPAETLTIIQAIESRYGIRVERIGPDAAEVEAMTSAYGRDLFRDSVPQRMLCCNVRKVRPLAKRLAGVSGWFSGIRRGQNAERADVQVFDRTSTPVRISPLAGWNPEDVAQYTLDRGLPEHPLYAEGFASIGCEPCTRAISAGEDERAGRWWWESDAAKECGLHFSADGRAERTVDVLIRDVLSKAGAV
jgi:phosphoadenosine phosphosulfate reductase